MKRKFLTIVTIVTLALMPIFMFNCNVKEEDSVSELRKQHLSHLENSPYKETQKLSRSERKDLGLPPNAYNEQLWELTMDPSTGRPMPERALAVQEDLREQRIFLRGVGGDDVNPWVDRGPNDQGGRTRGIMFDPNDVGNANPNDDYTRVFAGGVSGGLWVNEDITDPDSSWTLVPGLQENIAVTVIISDPNDSNKLYIGSGEPYIGADGAVIGRGVYRSIDGGVTWENVIGGFTGVSNGGQNVDGIFYVSDIVARDNGGVTELYAAFPSGRFVEASGPNNFLGGNSRGLYKSIDDGVTWTRFDIQFTNGNYKNPNDIELDANNNVWLTTTSDEFGQGGGDIYRSTDGISFTLMRSFGASRRTELETHPTNPNLLWVVCNIGGEADIFRTTDAFASPANLFVVNEPNDADNGIPANDYTRNQAFYNLPIEIDENSNLYVGGIDLFRSEDFGNTWTQISKWSNNNNLAALNVPRVHADQHAIVFRPGTNGSEAVFGNDGGIYYAPDMSNVVGNANGIQTRNKDFNTIQFYYGAIDPNSPDTNLAGGTQDNGTQFVNNATPGANAFFDPVGGDGGFTEFGAAGDYVITTYPRNSHRFISYPSFTNFSAITNQGGGSFINEAALDKNLVILYANASSNANGIAIERVKEFLPGGAARENDLLTSGQFNATPSALKVSPFTTTSSTLYVGLRSGRLLRGTLADIANPAFINISGTGFVGSISDIEFGLSEQEIFVTMYNYGVQSVWFTDDGGATWRSIEGNLPDVPVRCILQNPLIPEELIIGTELGVWATGDYTVPNPSWVQSYNGMSDAVVTDLDLKASDNTILATTFGRGFFTSQFTPDPLSVLESEFNSNTIVLYPTISEGDITITSKIELGNANITVYNLNGQNVYNSILNLSPSNAKLNLNLNSGIYFVDIRVDNYSETKKIIIK
ncbi:Por secretion system C-terminal sorting domain-containing protein [Formosa sp. Hel1_31_208]|uniref:T9SS type A sorting domain-containing protein n=1 Tax=Formosa sp. Hel1_31_208 TaxID=1798225 RepID=UPI00087AF6E5|nr:T9SS type A sorting domain-containing protein [Formosa sp. Hel1_31_208]SDR68551.1 Por secretion system C-terminal sorting domain-containing protein [Formosa sp. Hel1_31_208]